MALQSSGSISLGQVNTELGRSATATISLGESAVRTLAGIASGTISLSNLYGKSNIAPTASFKGYWAGGDLSSGQTAVIDGIQFSNDSTFNPSISMGDGGRRNSGATHASTRGYSMGHTSGTANSIDGITFSSETAYNPSASLSPAVWSGTVNSYTVAYGGSSTGSNQVAAFTFATETAYTPSSTFAQYTEFGGLSNNSSGKGYFVGGESGTKTVTYYNTFRGILFSNDTAFSVSATLAEYAISKITNATSQKHNSYGLIFGGNGGTGVSSIDGMDLSNETSYNPSATLSDIRWYVSSPNSNDKAYPAGGLYGTTSIYNGIQTYTFSNATAASLGYAMNQGTRWSAGKYSYGGSNIY